MPVYTGRSDVYIEELDLSGEPSPVPTSTGAIVFASKRGRVGPFRVNDVNSFLEEYGNPDASISFGHHCSLAFLAQSNQLWASRVVGSGATYGGITLRKKPAETQPVVIPTSQQDPVNQGVSFATLSGATAITDNLLYFYSIGPGSYSSSIEIKIGSQNMNPPQSVVAADFSTVGVIIAGVSSAGSINAGTYTYTVVAKNSVGATLQSAVASVTIAGAGTSVYLTWAPVAGATQYLIYGRSGLATAHLLVGQVGGGQTYFVDYGVVVPAGAPATTQTFTDEFTLEIYDTSRSAGAPLESFTCTMFPKTNGLGEQLEVTQQINMKSKLLRVISNSVNFTAATVPPIHSIARTALSAGNSGAAVTSSDVILGWAAYEDQDSYQVQLLINGGYATPSVQLAMDALAAKRFDCVSILDTPANAQSAQNALDYRNNTLNLNSNRSALYTPDLLVQDPYSNSVLYVPPSGHVAGVYAFTDAVSYPWRAPAGLNRGLLSVLGLRTKYKPGEMDNLKRAQVNYIRSFPGLGRAVWEQRTLQAKLSALSFMNVRRLMDFLEQTAARFVRFEEFEPNDDFTRVRIRSALETILEFAKRTRGVIKYQVICDDRNNPKLLTANGQLKVTMLVTPTLPAETIIIQGVITQQGASFEELISAGGVF